MIQTIFEAVILVVLVVMIFLQTWRATLVPIVAIPVSLIGTFFVMSLFGFTINNLSLFGLVLAIGIVVDDAIVVVENVERNIERGLSPRDAALKSMDEVGGALVAIALVLSSVFIPAAFIPGISGQFYQQFALTIATRDGDFAVRLADAVAGHVRAAAQAASASAASDLVVRPFKHVLPGLQPWLRCVQPRLWLADGQDRAVHADDAVPMSACWRSGLNEFRRRPQASSRSRIAAI